FLTFHEIPPSICTDALFRQPSLILFSLDAETMSELLQRFKERFQMWHEERLGGPSGPPAGGGKASRNPLLWGALGAAGALLPPWHHRDAFDLLLPASAVIFLIFYFSKSRFAWHVLAAELLVVTPIYVFLSFAWRLQRALHPWIIWVPILGTVLIAGLLFWSRKKYFTYLEQQKEHAADERI
ncbi:MAG: hypothetical protein ABR611_15965, partial [Chthoniobacterales bacterium]